MHMCAHVCGSQRLGHFLNLYPSYFFERMSLTEPGAYGFGYAGLSVSPMGHHVSSSPVLGL